MRTARPGPCWPRSADGRSRSRSSGWPGGGHPLRALPGVDARRRGVPHRAPARRSAVRGTGQQPRAPAQSRRAGRRGDRHGPGGALRGSGEQRLHRHAGVRLPASRPRRPGDRRLPPGGAGRPDGVRLGQQPGRAAGRGRGVGGGRGLVPPGGRHRARVCPGLAPPRQRARRVLVAHGVRRLAGCARRGRPLDSSFRDVEPGYAMDAQVRDLDLDVSPSLDPDWQFAAPVEDRGTPFTASSCSWSCSGSSGRSGSTPSSAGARRVRSPAAAGLVPGDDAAGLGRGCSLRGTADRDASVDGLAGRRCSSSLCVVGLVTAPLVLRGHARHRSWLPAMAVGAVLAPLGSPFVPYPNLVAPGSVLPGGGSTCRRWWWPRPGGVRPRVGPVGTPSRTG